MKDSSNPILFPFNDENGKVGYIDAEGSVAIKPQFDGGDKFHEGLAKIVLAGKVGFIDGHGNLAIKPKYEKTYDASFFSHGRCNVQKNEKRGYIDPRGNKVTKFQYKYADPFFDGIAQCTDKDETIFIDTEGNTLFSLPPNCGWPRAFSEGLCLLQNEDNEKWGFIGRDGKLAIDFQFKFASSFSEGLALIEIEDYQRAFIDKSGRTIGTLPPFCNGCQITDKGFHEGYVTFQSSEGGGWITQKYFDTSGRELPLEHSIVSGEDFSEGLAIVDYGKKWGIINTQGRDVIEHRSKGDGSFNVYSTFHHGIAELYMHPHICFIDKNGDVVFKGFQ